MQAKQRRRRDDRRKERGAAAVEFGLAIPALLILVIGGLHLGRAMAARHQLTDAAGYGARAASVAGAAAYNTTTVINLVKARLVGNTYCSSTPTVTVAKSGASPYVRVQVSVSCTLKIFGGTLLAGIGPTSVSVAASMPLN